MEITLSHKICLDPTTNKLNISGMLVVLLGSPRIGP